MSSTNLPSPKLSYDALLLPSNLKAKKGQASSSNKGKEVINIEPSTMLTLFSDPWHIKKKLSASDIGSWGMILPSYFVNRLIVPSLMAANKANFREGLLIDVFDCDKHLKFLSSLRYKEKSKCFQLTSSWYPNVIRRRNLKKGDELGFFWDRIQLVLYFGVTERAE